MKYTKRLICFIDILGFGDLVDQSENNSATLELILDILHRIRAVDDLYASPDNLFAHSNYSSLEPDYKAKLNEVFEMSKEESIFNRIEVTTFSDSIVFSAAATEEGIGHFRYFLTKLLVYTSDYQLLLRGGLACGSLIHGNGLIFGPAMNKAYLTDSKVAKYPRIAIDHSAIALFDEFKGTSIGKILSREILTCSRDQVKYVDQLSICTNKVAQNMCNSTPLNTFKKIHDTLLELRGRYRENEKVLIKIDWFIDYYNDFIKRIREIDVVVSRVAGMPFETEVVSLAEFRMHK